jgi:hypothetical protein
LNLSQTAAMLAAALLFAGCETVPPNTPGHGDGKNYTPIIDLAGVDSRRYMDDLAACRGSAGMIDAERQELMGFIGGALLGAAIGASYSSDSRVIGGAANTGALHGGIRSGANARSRQAIVMGNCMASRGYRVLDGTANITFVAGQQPPTPPAAAVAPAMTAPAPAALAAPAPAPAPEARPAVPAGVIANPEAPPPKVTAPPSGKDVFVAEQLAKRMQCITDAAGHLVGKGPGYETYSFQCKGGETLVVRCEFGNCRPLR